MSVLCSLHLLTFIYHWCLSTVPAVLTSCNINLLYNQLSKRLLLINSSWNSMPVSHMTSNDKLYLGKLMLLSSLVSKHNPMQHLSHGASLKDMHRHAWAWPVYKVHYKTHITSSTADRSGDWHTSRETVHGCILGKSTPKWLSLVMTCYYSMRCLSPSTTQANYVQNGWNWVALLTAMNIKGTTLLILTIGLQKQDRLFLYHCLREPPNGLDVLVLLKADHRVKLRKRKHMFTIAWTWSYYCLHAFASDIEQLIPPICLSIFWAKKEVRRPCMYICIHKQKVFCLIQCGTTF